MFSTFILGILLMTSLIMVVLLVSPRPNDDVRANRLPYVGAMAFLLFAALAILSGFAVAS